MLFALSVGVTLAAAAQKDELKEASKSFKKGDAAETLTILESVSSTIGSAEDKYQADYYLLLGNASLQLAKAGDSERYQDAISAYQSLIAMEEASGETKYTDEVAMSLADIANQIYNKAVEDQKNNNYVAAAEKLYKAYSLSPTDTIILYQAAMSAIMGKDNRLALDYYVQLRDLNYDGSEKRYGAISIESSEMEYFQDKATRDLYVKGGTHKDQKDEITESKTSEIVKNIAIIYQMEGDSEKALEAYDEAINQNPGDVSLLMNKAGLYFSLGNEEKFKELTSLALEMDPKNPNLYYNLGVVNYQQGNVDDARNAYIKVLELDPTYVSAILNLSVTFIDQANDLNDEMNELGMSKEDEIKFNELKNVKSKYFLEGVKVLEAGLKELPSNNDILTNLKNIYAALGDDENYLRIKGVLENL